MKLDPQLVSKAWLDYEKSKIDTPDFAMHMWVTLLIDQAIIHDQPYIQDVMKEVAPLCDTSSLKHAFVIDMLDDYLEHYGEEGMQWLSQMCEQSDHWVDIKGYSDVC